LALATGTTQKTSLLRAKVLLTDFLGKCSQVSSFKEGLLDFFNRVRLVEKKISERLSRDKLRMAHLHLLFDREVEIMKNGA